MTDAEAERLGIPPLRTFNAASLARAEAALLELSSQFEQWLKDEIERLRSALELLLREPEAADRRERVYIAAHNLKGLGATYNHPLVSRLAASLCRLMEDGPAAPLRLIDAHVEAIARVSGSVPAKDDEESAFAALVDELELKTGSKPG